MRLNRYLALCGLGSRRAVEDLIRFGRVQINGSEAGLATDVTDTDRVEVDGKSVRPEEKHSYLLFNKPAGYLCSRGDTHGRPTVYDLLPPELHRLHYVGRLDKDSRGLLFFTSDGELTASLTHPSHGVLRIYEVDTEYRLTQQDMELLLEGVEVEDGVTLKCASVRETPRGYQIGLREGKKREIRRLLYALNHRVVDLKRIEFGGVKLGDLPEGDFRELSPEELRRLRPASNPFPERASS
jgi:23S rRNA pseudouridine2605 synthase